MQLTVKSIVDFFQLEPQRGKASFTGAPVSGSNGSCPAGSVSAGSGCIEAVVPELNRAYDTLPISTKHVAIRGLRQDARRPRLMTTRSSSLCSPTRTFHRQRPFRSGAPTGPWSATRTWSPIFWRQAYDPIAELRAKGLVYTLAGIAAVNGGTCPDFTPATVRVKFTYRSILDNGVVGTRSQCVLGLHDYHDKVCFTDEQVLRSAPNPMSTDDTFTYSSCRTAAFVVP